MTERDDSATHLWLVLYRASRAVEAHADRHIASLGLAYSDFAVLEVLLHRGPLPVNAIGAKVLLTSGSMTTAVDRLEGRGLVERRVVPEDRRSRRVHLTRAGRRLITRAFAAHEEVLAEATAGLDASERGQAIRLLRKLGLGAQERLG